MGARAGLSLVLAGGFGVALAMWWLGRSEDANAPGDRPPARAGEAPLVEREPAARAPAPKAVITGVRSDSADPLERRADAGTYDPPPRRPNLERLRGAARVKALNEFRRARAEWRARNHHESPSRARVWASRLLHEPALLTAKLDLQAEKELEDLYVGLYSEIREVRYRMEVAKDPIYRERLANGQFEEREVDLGYPKAVPGIIHVYGMFPSRNDPNKTIRRVVTIRPGESSQLDRLRAEENRLRQLAQRTLRERIRF